MTKQLLSLAALAVSVGVAADHNSKAKDKSHGMETAGAVVMKDASGKTVGEITVMQAKKGVHFQGQLEGLPTGVHGFHIHETGACEAPAFESAGGHFNPTGDPHGSADGKEHHAGDMKNIEVSADGSVNLDVMNKAVSAEGNGSNSLFKEGGTALVIHANADDYKSQPSGEAGDRIACGVIEKSNSAR